MFMDDLEWFGRAENERSPNRHFLRCPLLHVVLARRVDILQFMLDEGHDKDELFDEVGLTALQTAAFEGAIAVGQALLAAGADVNLRCRGGMSALDLAVQKGHVDIARAIIEHGADVNAAGTDGRAALHNTAAAGNAELVSLLRLKGADIDMLDGGGRTPLQTAASSGHMAAAQALPAAGADVSLRYHKGNSALDLAVQKENVGMARAIVEKGAAVNAVDPDSKTALHAASSLVCSKAEMVSMLLANGAAVDALDGHGRTPLHAAISSGQTIVTQALLAAGADVNLRCREGRSALDRAAEAGHVDIARMIIEQHGADVNVAGANGQTPLHAASRAGKLECMLLLLAKGADLNALDGEGLSPLTLGFFGRHDAAVRALLVAGAEAGLGYCPFSSLDWAVQDGDVDLARMMIERGADVNSSPPSNSGTPLSCAAVRDDAEMVGLLVSMGAKVNKSSDDPHDHAPIYWATECGGLAAVQALLAAGADVNLRGDYGKLPLHHAVERGHLDIARAIIEHGADVNAADAEGKTTLHIAAASRQSSHAADEQGNSVEIILLLLNKGAAIDAFCRGGQTPLQEAVYAGRGAEARALISAGAVTNLGMNTPDWELVDMPPLHLAASRGDVDILRALIEHGAEVSAADGVGRVALHKAARSGRAEAVDALLDAGADIEQETYDGDAPLHLAPGHRGVEAVRVLLAHSASINKQNDNGQTPLHMAAAFAGAPRGAESVDLLLRHGADEEAIDVDGQRAGDVVGSRVYEEISLVEDDARVRKLLVNAPADRAWRRRGFLALCRSHYHSGRVQLGHGSCQARAGIAGETPSSAGLSRADIDWAGVASMLMGAGSDPISLMGDGADLIFETIVGFL